MSTAVGQTIDLSGGAVEYTYPVTITASPKADGLPVDISADPVKMSLGTFTEPGSWLDSDITEHPSTAQAVVQLLIGTALRPAVGTYWLWVKVTDSAEIVPRRSELRITIT
jgi:hypothetical protein